MQQNLKLWVQCKLAKQEHQSNGSRVKARCHERGNLPNRDEEGMKGKNVNRLAKKERMKERKRKKERKERAEVSSTWSMHSSRV